MHACCTSRTPGHTRPTQQLLHRLSRHVEEAAQGACYVVLIHPERALKLSLVYTARTITEHAFVLPLDIQTGTTPTSNDRAETERLIVAECLATRITVSSPQFEYGACIIPSTSSVQPPYEELLELTNEQDAAMAWCIGEPSTNMQEGCTGVFTVVPSAGELPAFGSATVKVCALAPLCPLRTVLVRSILVGPTDRKSVV